MGPLLLAFAVAQAPLARDVRAGVERKYRVAIDQEGGDHYAYRLRLRMVKPKVPKGMTPNEGSAATRLDLRLTDYRATMDEQKVSAPFVGGGEMPLEGSGLPGGLNVTGPSGPVWLPLLAFYLPSGGKEGEFAIAKVAVGPGLDLAGKGTASRGGGRLRLDLDAALVAEGQEMGKLTISTTLDGAGWPEKAEGKLVSADGTFRFTLVK